MTPRLSLIALGALTVLALCAYGAYRIVLYVAGG